MRKTEELAKLAAHYEAIGRPDLAREVDAAVASHTIRLSSGNKVGRETERLEREMAGVMDTTDLDRKTGRKPATHTPQDSIDAHAPFQQRMDDAGEFAPVYPGSTVLMMKNPEAFGKAYRGVHRNKLATEGKYRHDAQKRVQRMIADIDDIRSRDGHVVDERDAALLDRIKEIIARHDPTTMDSRQVDNFDSLTSEFEGVLSEIWKRAERRHYAIERRKGIPSPADESYERSQARRRASTDGRTLFRVAQGDPFGDDIGEEDLALLEKNKREEMKRAFDEMLAKMSPEERQFFEDFGMTREEAHEQQRAEIAADEGSSAFVERGGPELFDEEDPRERGLYSSLNTSDNLLRLAQHLSPSDSDFGTSQDPDNISFEGKLKRQKHERSLKPAQPSYDGISTHCDTCGTNSPGDHDHCPLCFSDYVERKPNPKMNEFRMSCVSDELLRMSQVQPQPKAQPQVAHAQYPAWQKWLDWLKQQGKTLMTPPSTPAVAAGVRANSNPSKLVRLADYVPKPLDPSRVEPLTILERDEDGVSLLYNPKTSRFFLGNDHGNIKEISEDVLEGSPWAHHLSKATQQIPESRGNVFHNPNWEEKSGTRP